MIVFLNTREEGSPRRGVSHRILTPAIKSEGGEEDRIYTHRRTTTYEGSTVREERGGGGGGGGGGTIGDGEKLYVLNYTRDEEEGGETTITCSCTSECRGMNCISTCAMRGTEYQPVEEDRNLFFTSLLLQCIARVGPTPLHTWTVVVGGAYCFSHLTRLRGGEEEDEKRVFKHLRARGRRDDYYVFFTAGRKIGGEEGREGGVGCIITPGSSIREGGRGAGRMILF